ADRLPARHPPGDRESHRDHPRDRDPHAEGSGAAGPDPGGWEGDRPPARLREVLRLVRAVDPHAPAARGPQLRSLEAEEAVLELGGDPVAVHFLAQAEGPGEGAVVTLHPIETLRTRALHLPLSAHRQLVALDLDL